MAQTLPNSIRQIEESLEKFKKLQANLRPDASERERQFLAEMISVGERSLVALKTSPTMEPPVSKFSLKVSPRRIGEILKALAFGVIVVFVFKLVFNAFQRVG
jgi:hypothetical protein